MIVRVGIPACFSTFSRVAVEMKAPMLVSANALYRLGKFRLPSPDRFSHGDVALDSAGFVAMHRYGGYRWSVEDYVRLAAHYPWAWWASMDFCCEPQIARDRDEVRRRVEKTAVYLGLCRASARRHDKLEPPMPVLQGWFPDDYVRCADRIDELQDLVGLGSVCRRDLGGEAGIVPVLERLDRVLPRRVQLHLFGVKGHAIRQLAGHPRIRSVDSLAWDFAARRERERNAVASSTVAYRIQYLQRWYREQCDGLGLFARSAAE